MRTILSLALVLILCPVALTVFSADASDDVVEERKVKLKLVADDGDPVKLDLSDLEIGDTTQFTTDSGKLVTATRDDEGYLIDIDGKEIRVASPENFDHDHDGGGAHRVMVKVIENTDGEDGEHQVRVEKRVVVSADGDVLVGEDGHKVKVIRLGHGDGHGEGDGEHGIKVLTDFDCEDSHEECIEQLLSEHGINIQIDEGADGEKNVEVIVIKKMEETEED
jgi:hypothetical protein